MEESSTEVQVRLLADYSHEDIALHRGEEFVVLGYHGDDWVYVSRGDGLQPCYVPTCCVQRVGLSPMQSPTIKQRTLPTSSVSRSRTFASSSDSKMASGMAGVIRSLSMRNSVHDQWSPTSSTRERDSDSDDLPDPPSYALSSPALRDVINLATPASDNIDRRDDSDVTTGALPSPVVRREDDDVTGVQPSDLSANVSGQQVIETSRRRPESLESQHPENEIEESTPMYANWAEIQRLVKKTTGPTSDMDMGVTPCTNDDVSSVRPMKPSTTPTSPSPITAAYPALNYRSNSDNNNSKDDPNWLQNEDKSDEVFTTALLHKHGCLQCLHATENGKTVVPSQWKTMYTSLRGALLSFFNDESSAQDTSNGPVQLPETSLGLQGAVVQMTRYDYPAYDVIKIITSFNTMHLLHASTVDQTHSWCRYIKHNVAVLLADRTARMESATPVSTFTSIPKPRGSGKSTSDSSSAVTRVAQRLKDLLGRRPSREDLKDRGIYTDPLFGSTLSAVCAKDKTLVPVFLMQCFREIEQRGLTISGIYRLSGSISKVQKLRIRANQGDYDVSDVDDIHTLTGIVRVFFRELAEPLVPFEFFERCCDSYKKSNQSARQEAFIRLIQDLPDVNRMTMKELFRHLEKVIENNAENQMTSHNLAIVFGPTLMWLPVNNEKNYSAMVVLQGQVVEYLIKEHRNLFAITRPV